MSFCIYRVRLYFSAFNNNNNNRWWTSTRCTHHRLLLFLFTILLLRYIQKIWIFYGSWAIWVDDRGSWIVDHGSAETAPHKFMVKNDNQLKMVMINGIETSILWIYFIWKLIDLHIDTSASWYRILAIGNIIQYQCATVQCAVSGIYRWRRNNLHHNCLNGQNATICTENPRWMRVYACDLIDFWYACLHHST